MKPKPIDERIDEILKLHASYHYGGGREGELSDEEAKEAINRLIVEARLDVARRARVVYFDGGNMPVPGYERSLEITVPMQDYIAQLEQSLKEQTNDQL